MGINNCSSSLSKEDQTQKISKSVFVMNFPEHFIVRDLWNVCLAYGNIVDVFIPFKRSKAGKKFAFVYFIRVDKLDRLIEILSTIWIGRLRLHANVVRFQRESKTNDVQPIINDSQPNKSFVGSIKNLGVENTSFASILNTRRGNPNKVIDSSPAIVLDDECHMKRNFSCSLIGKIKDINAFPNLYLILSNKGFQNVKLTYLDGLWVLLDMDTIESKEKIHIKELEPWSPNFLKAQDDSSQFDDDLVGDEKENNSEKFINDFELDNEKELDHVSETSFTHENDMVYNQASKCSEHSLKSYDPFGIYNILKKNNDMGVLDKNKDNVMSDNNDPQFPPGFTPNVGSTPDVGKVNVEEVKSTRNS
ncbi:RNA-directed DNA polymerase, eukaryota [Tanacetum coccineum]